MLWSGRSGVQLPAGIRDSSLPEHPDLLLFKEYMGSFSGVGWLGHEIDHLPLSSAEFRSEQSSTSVFPVCFHGDDRDITFFTVPLLANKMSKKLSTSLDAYNYTPVFLQVTVEYVTGLCILVKVYTLVTRLQKGKINNTFQLTSTLVYDKSSLRDWNKRVLFLSKIICWYIKCMRFHKRISSNERNI
jgi:hypothetical protein